MYGKNASVHSQNGLGTEAFLKFSQIYLTQVIKQPIFQIPNLEYLQQNFCFDFFNDSENTFWGFFEI